MTFQHRPAITGGGGGGSPGGNDTQVQYNDGGVFAGTANFVVNASGEVVIGGVTPVAGTKLLLPQENDDSTPTLAFGDGDSGFYESSANNIRVSIAGIQVLRFFSGGMMAISGGAVATSVLLNEIASSTNPNIIPNGDDLDTGIGVAAVDRLSLIAGGVEQARLSVDGNHVVNSLLDAASGDEVALSLNYTVNKATSGDDTGLVINQTDTASPGTSVLADFQVGGTSVFLVDNVGFVGINIVPAAQLHVQTSGTGVIGQIIKATAAQTADLLLITDSADAELFVVNETGEVSIGGVTPVAGTKLLLPLEDNAGTPTLAFGDGDSGFYEDLDDRISISMAGIKRFQFFANSFEGHAGTLNAAAMLNEVASDTNPVHVFRGDFDTGLGHAADDQLSLIAGGVEQVRLDVTGNHIVNSLLNEATGDEVALSLNYTTSKATSGNDTGLLINKTDTASPGTSLLLDLKIDGTSLFLVDNVGFVGINIAPAAQLHVQTSGTGIIGQIIKATAAQTADLLLITDSADAELFVVNATGEVSVGGVTPVAGTKLLLPLEDDAATPTLAFGDGDTGFYESADDTLKLTLAGNFSWQFTSGSFLGANVAGPIIRNVTASGTVPTIIPKRSDVDTGLGSSADDQLSLIAGGVERMRLNSIGAIADDAIGISNLAEGSTARLTTRTTHETHTLTLGATSNTTSISIPSGARLLGVSMNVNTAVVDDGGNDNWSAAFITGSTTPIVTGKSPNTNTKVDFMVPDEITTDVTEIQFTPNGGSFTAGIIEIVAYYEELTSLANV